MQDAISYKTADRGRIHAAILLVALALQSLSDGGSLLASNTLAADTDRFSPIRFALDKPARVSLGVYDDSGKLVRTLRRGQAYEAGRVTVSWDGLDRLGNAAPPGNYEWRLLKSQGFTARFLCPLGVNPPTMWDGNYVHAWVGDHLGAGAVCVDETGVTLAAAVTEAPLIVVKHDHDFTKRLWQRRQWYTGGAVTALASANGNLFAQQPNAGRTMRVLNPNNGGELRAWDNGLDGEAPGDIDAFGETLVSCYPKHNAIRFAQSINGVSLRVVRGLTGARHVAVRDDGKDGEVLVVMDKGVVSITQGDPRAAEVVLRSPGLGPIDIDHTNGDVYVVAHSEDREEVRRYDRDWNLLKTYGGKVRPDGLYNPLLFKGISDIAADQRGGFYITEPGPPPRRAAHFNAETGELIREWYGGQSFFTHLTSDPENPRHLWGASPESAITQYGMDYDSGKWTVRACYNMSRFGDSLFPMGGPVKVVHRGGETYLRMEAPPALLRVDEKKGLVPVCITWNVKNDGRAHQQFSGTGRDGYPKPWVAAVEAAGHTDLAKAPKIFYWGDLDGDGQFDPDEFRFPDFQENVNQQQRRAFDNDWNAYFGGNGYGDRNIQKLPMTEWFGPSKALPFWDWDQLIVPHGLVPEELTDSCNLRDLCAEPDGTLYGVIQGGIMIAGHGQHEGGGWNVGSINKARLAKWHPDGSLAFSVSRHSKNGGERGQGVLFYPMGVSLAPHGTLLVTDSVLQPGEIWTRDGLYAGSLLDHRADDGLPGALYGPMGDDVRGGHILQLADGRVFWFQQAPGVWYGYEVTGWDRLNRQTGRIMRPPEPRTARRKGEGLKATYYRDEAGTDAAFTSIEPPMYFEQFGGDPHPGKLPTPPYRVVYEGYLEAPHTEPYGWEAWLAGDEEITFTIGNKTIYHNQGGKLVTDERPLLKAGSTYPVRIDYINRTDRPHLKFLMFSRTLDKARIPADLLYPPKN